MVTNRSLTSTLDRMMTLNRALDQALGPNWNGNQVWVPAVDVVERKDSYVMYAELPGVDASAVDISFEQNVLTIRGTKPSSFDPAQQVSRRAQRRQQAGVDPDPGGELGVPRLRAHVVQARRRGVGALGTDLPGQPVGEQVRQQQDGPRLREHRRP